MSEVEKDKDVKKIVNAMKDIYRLQFTAKQFGEIEFRIISYKEFSRIDALLKETTDDKKFAQNLLYGLIVNPIFSSADFQKISDNELKSIIWQFSKKNEALNTYLGEPIDEQLYSEFRKAVKKYNDEKFDEFSKTISAVAVSFNKSIQEMFMKKFISQLIIPQIDFYQLWLRSNQKIFDNLTKPFQNLQESLKKYETSVQNLNRFLIEYNWFFSFSLPEECYGKFIIIKNEGIDVEQRINQVFVRYISQNNYQTLKEMIDEWDKNTLFKPRMEIIKDCLLTLKNISSGYNPSNVVLPVLIAQIDGILMDFIKKHGFTFDRRSKKWKSPSGEIFDLKKAYTSVEADFEFISEFSNDLLLNVLFQNAYHGDELKNLPTFNRHKILHGESIDYGKLENIIRAFLILDFLSYLE